jgi:hypothetical protein
MLTTDQIQHFRTIGFLLLEQAFDAPEIGEITREADDL